jgi:PAS domain-containing protein
MAFDPLMGFGLVITAVLAAFSGVLILAVLQKRLSPPKPGIFLENAGDTEFLFDGDKLIDATPTARGLLPKGGTAAWPRLLTYLERHFPLVSERFAKLQAEGAFIASSGEGTVPALLLRAELRGGLTRISIINTESTDSIRADDTLTRHAIQEELDLLRNTTAKAPMPIWRESQNGDVVWANARYLELATETLAEDEDLTWPLPQLFQRGDSTPGQRQKLQNGRDGATHCFDVFSFDEPSGRLIFAQPSDSAVHAEETLRAFMQTLTKTFAHLSTGLAIFDQNRKLALFNPALVDLTNLPPELLSSRPSLITFFDGLRERSMIPEARDYRTWRNQITDLEQAAATGLYEETWSLPGGQTYHVIGRPHPNGALALSIEDISTEMSQTRRYRADLELGQAVIDAMDEAIAVFSAAGVLVMSNTAYTDLWGHDPAASLGNDGGSIAVCEYWRANSAPSAIWDRAEDYVATMGERAHWADETRLADGRRVGCRFARLAGGATLAAFRLLEVAENPQVEFTSSRKTA